MAKLKIFNSINDEETKTILEGWFGIESVCFNDVREFIDRIPEDDNDIDVHLHCPGGSCIEGFAIYDALRTSGKKISTVVEGMCASMATVIMMAAPKERRFAQANASLCIHNPYIPNYVEYQEAAHADDLDNLAKKVQLQADSLRETQEKILDVYVERTSTDRDTLQSLMDEDRFITTDKALELGLIGEILKPNTDNKMGKVTVEASLLSKVLSKLGIAKLEDLKDMVITAADGTEITIDRTEGTPLVGDKATPDGNFVMDDGSTLHIADGVITAIDEPKDDKDTKIVSLEAQVSALTQDKDALAQEVENLKANVKTEEDVANLARVSVLVSKVQSLEAANDALTTEKEALKASAKTEDEQTILDKVTSIVGDMDACQWLDLASKASSSFVPNKPAFNEHNNTPVVEESIGASYLASKRAMRAHSIEM